MLFPLKLPPGMLRTGTAYDAKGRWWDGQYIRFVGPSPRPIGSWSPLTTSGSPSGYARTLLAWRNNAGTPQLAVGTNTKAYVFIEGTLTDITLAGTTTGNASASFATGLYGAGNYGAGNYGGGDSTQSALIPGATWQFDAFGQLLVGVLSSDGRFMSWDANTANDFILVVATSGSVPTGNIGVVVTNERFAFVLGAGGDARKIQWPSQETLGDFAATATNTAGDFLLPGSGKIVCGRRTRNATLIFTDQDLFAAQYIGGTLIYAFNQVGAGCGAIGPNAVAMVDGRAEWMGHNGFYQFDGYVKPLPCDVQDYVFQNLNRTQAFKCFALPQPDFKEIWYFFPSSDGVQADEPERYVIHNYAEGHWTIGKGLMRSAAFERGVFEYPFMTSPAATSTIYEHERGSLDAGGSFVESGPIELGDGERVMELTSLIPDQSDRNGQVLEGLQATLYAAMYPTGDETTLGPYDLANPTSLRATARQVRLRIGSPQALFIAAGGGTINISPDGLNWETVYRDINVTFKAVVYANGLYVAVGSNGTIVTSPDAVQWTSRMSGFGTRSINGVAYGNGTWLAVGSGGLSSTSTDGLTWTVNTALSAAPTLNCAIYAFGKWVVGALSSIIYTTTDFVTWTPHSVTGNFRAVAMGQTLLVMVGDTGTAQGVWTSPDGLAWTSRTAAHATAGAYQGLAWNGSIFATVGWNNLVQSIIASSPDGITWTSRTAPFTGVGLWSLAWSNANKLFVAGGSTLVAESVDGVTWTSISGGAYSGIIITGLGAATLTVPADWRLGVPRLEVRAGSRR